MATVAFIGLGNMGYPMAQNLGTAGHDIQGFDVSPRACEAGRQAGLTICVSVSEAVSGAQMVITMLPTGEHVAEVYMQSGGVLSAAAADTLLIDCSTIDVATARNVAAAAAAAGREMIDAPVSGGVGGAEAATLTFMVGGTEPAFARARPLLEAMGRAIVHCGGAGNGQVAKICNNLILGISMIGVSEAFVLAEALGLEQQKLFDVASNSSGQCWSLTSYCPVPGPVPTSPANRDYQAGFTADMMLKDLHLAQEAARTGDAPCALGALAEDIYQQYSNAGNGGVDFSGIVRFLRG